MIITIDSKCLESLRDFLEALSVNRIDLIQALQERFDLTENITEKIEINLKSTSLLSEVKAYHEASQKVDELLKELIENFAEKQEGETE